MEAPKPPSLLESYSSRGDDLSVLDEKIVSGMFNVASSPYGSVDLTKLDMTSEASEAVYEVPLGPQFAFADDRLRMPSFYEIESRAGTKLIDMDDYGSVDVHSGDTAKIATFGLCGCTAVAVVSEYLDGSKSAHVQHFSPICRKLSESVFRSVMTKNQGVVSRKVVVMVPGQWVQNGDGNTIIVPKDQASLNSLLQAGNLSDGDNARVCSYDESICIGQYGQGTLMVELGDEPVIYTEMCPVEFE
jgi:hypothetical protein